MACPWSQACPESRRKLHPRDPECYHLTMSTEEYITLLTAQIADLQAQLTHHSWSPPPPQPSAAPPPPPKPPKVSAPSPFSGAQDNLNCFKAKCSLYLSMRQSEFLDECSNVLFILLYMKGGSAGPWATQKISSILFWIGWVEDGADFLCSPGACRSSLHVQQDEQDIAALVRELGLPHTEVEGTFSFEAV